ncbi:DUF4129 domain-containing protein [Kitasatospora purpeofusca]|uniref:DUF4129 domain-containing protein n=1 Tax=Kitasatospora purpeofusca TaxID=67352 RepID=UPI002A5A4966|nr:DUF4129 domain-containing protein [Kitasatospora purpeofusca]MDY0816517.1 DUF4129 domain-containing protein [Kitasatospora purpeofusca]
MNDEAQPIGPRHDGRDAPDDSAGEPARRSGGRIAGVLVTLAGLLLAASALRPDGGLLGAPLAKVPVQAIGFVLLLALGWLIAVGRFALRFRAEVRHLDGPTPWAERLREAAAVLLPGAAVAVPVLMFLFHNRADTGPGGPHRARPLPDFALPPVPTVSPPEPREPVPDSSLSGVIQVLFGALLAVLVIAVVVGVVLLLRLRIVRRRPPAPLPAAPARTEDALAAAVVTGRRALTGADARAAVIACYAAMETSLAASGLSLRAPDSPTELLERAMADDRVDPVHARALTALFREARYSTHPMDETHVRRARTALDALAGRPAERTAPPPEPVAVKASGAVDRATGGHR